MFDQVIDGSKGIVLDHRIYAYASRQVA